MDDPRFTPQSNAVIDILNHRYWSRIPMVDLIAELEWMTANLDSNPDGADWHRHQIVGLQAEIERRQRQPRYTVSESSKIPKPLVDEIKSKIDLAALMSRDLMLIGPTSDRHYRAVCPFHDDKRPSMVVYTDDGRYHCFGCGAGGDVIQWLMAYHNLTFREAVTELAARAGIAMPEVRLQTKPAPASILEAE